MKIDNDLSFADLMAMKIFLEKELQVKKEWRDSGRAYSYDEWEKRCNAVAISDIPDKIKVLNERIQEIIRVAFF